MAFPKNARNARATTENKTIQSQSRHQSARRQPRSNIRSCTEAYEPQASPKSKRHQHAKRADERRAKQEANAEAKQARKKGANSHHNPPRSSSPSSYSSSSSCAFFEAPPLTPEEERIREEVLAAMDGAALPSTDQIGPISLAEYERTLAEETVEVIDSFGTSREITSVSAADIFFGGDKASWSISPTRKVVARGLRRWILDANPDVAHALQSQYRYDLSKSSTKRGVDALADSILTRSVLRDAKDFVTAHLDARRWMSFVAQNRRYPFAVPFADAIDAVAEHDLRAYSRPAGDRRFILDVGPTNSGKTHSGMVELSRAESGVYLGPLRLLAMEAADALNEMGCPCSMLTGEERRDVEGARHVASTVEMLDRNARYEVAVIDECQMITDPERGYAWAAAISCVDADVIHLCLAPEATDLICSILDGLGEEYEIEEHYRLVPLEMQQKNVRYPSGIRRGDAIIVFSRKSVQRYVSELSSHGISASMVYGALPYEVRKEEVRKFADGETDVVVATDAIGMGLNLPIQRVVFAELEKFDGNVTRDLTESEIKQIAGRAGRYGRYDLGYVSVLRGQDRGLVEASLRSETFQVDEIRVDMPPALMEIDDLPLSHIMRAWSMSGIGEPYVKRNLDQQISLARRVEDLPNDFVASAVEIPFKSGDRFVPLDNIWERSVRAAYEGREFSLSLYPITPEDSLQYLEDAAKMADLAYGLAKRYGTQEDMDEVDLHRKQIGQYMIDNLRGHVGGVRMCHWCGRALSEKSKHPMHDKCYREWRDRKYSASSWTDEYEDEYSDKGELERRAG